MQLTSHTGENNLRYLNDFTTNVPFHFTLRAKFSSEKPIVKLGLKAISVECCI